MPQEERTPSGSSRMSRRRQPARKKGFPAWIIALAGGVVLAGVLFFLLYPVFHRKAMITDLVSGDAAARKIAAAELRKDGVAVVDPLIQAASERCAPDAAPDVAALLMELTGDSRPYLVKKVRGLARSWAASDKAPMRSAAAALLAHYFDKSDKNLLEKLVTDPSAEVRLQVVSSLRGSARCLEGVEVAAEALADKEYKIRHAAGGILRKIICEETAPFLLEQARTVEDPDLKARFLRLLSNFTSSGAVSLEQIEPFLKHPSPVVRREAVVAVGYSGKEEAADLLAEALKDPSSDVRFEAVEKTLYGHYSKLGPVIASMMYDEPSKKVKLQMFKICGPMRMNYAAPELVRIAGNEKEDREVRLAALETLYKLSLSKPEERIPLAKPLIQVMKSPDREVAEKAVRVGAVLVRGRAPKTVAGWEKWLENKKKELKILEQIKQLHKEVEALAAAKKYDEAAGVLFKIQDLYGDLYGVCDEDDQAVYDRRARKLNIEIRHMTQRAAYSDEEKPQESPKR